MSYAEDYHLIDPRKLAEARHRESYIHDSSDYFQLGRVRFSIRPVFAEELNRRELEFLAVKNSCR